MSRRPRGDRGGNFTQRVRLTGRGDEFDQLAETINDMLDRMARLMEGVREVSNAIAHDLRTPITRARVRLEDAAAHAGSVAELRAAIERAITDLDGIVAVFQALLRIAEIEAGSRRAAFARLISRRSSPMWPNCMGRWLRKKTSRCRWKSRTSLLPMAIAN